MSTARLTNRSDGTGAGAGLRRLAFGGCLCLALVIGRPAGAHVSSNGFLTLTVHGRDLLGSVELAVRDVELAVGADTDHDGRVTWGELRGAAPRLEEYLRSHLNLSARGTPCPLSFESVEVNDRVDGNYAWLSFRAHCAAPVQDLSIGYRLMRGIDPSHRGLLTLSGGSSVQTGVLGGSVDEVSLAVYSASTGRAFEDYLRAGIWHIWSGIDHLLFLFSLLLPAVLLRRQGQWLPVARIHTAFSGVLKIVTAFTIAHSITLTLAALELVRLPTRLTESAIAASIIVAAVNNIFPVVTESRARIAFAFGLLHGFGFASVLADMGLPAGAKLISLLSFNLGIEVGQLAVVIAVMPLIYALRTGVFYRRAVMPWGSAAIALLATVWLVQRAILPAG